MRTAIAIGALTVAVLVGGAPLAHAAPGCDGRCNVTSTGGSTNANGGSTDGGSSNKGGSHGAQPTIPTVKLPPPAIITAQTVVQTAPPPPPRVKTPPPVIEIQQPVIPTIPQLAPPPAVVPVAVAPPAPVPVEIPLPATPPAPSAPVVTPVSRVLFTSSADPGTQALTIIVLFMAAGCWVYGNRIGSQITVRKKDRATAGA
jgi:hypothetical protein